MRLADPRILIALTAAGTLAMVASSFCAHRSDGACAFSLLHLAGAAAVGGSGALALLVALRGPRAAWGAAQAALGLAGIVFGLLLITGLSWWVLGNLLYGVLALAAGLLAPRPAARTLAHVAAGVFLGVNGVAGVLALAGGAVLWILGALAAVGAPQLALLGGWPRPPPDRPDR